MIISKFHSSPMVHLTRADRPETLSVQTFEGGDTIPEKQTFIVAPAIREKYSLLNTLPNLLKLK